MNEIFDDLYIFEMANNHQGDPEHGFRIIKAMGEISRKHGIRSAVKFQYRDLETFVHPDFKNREDVKHIPRFMSTRLADSQFEEMLQAVREEGMLAVVTPFDEASVAKCVEHEVDILKIASCSADDWPLIEAIAETDIPVIASTGGVSVYEIDNLASFFNHRKVEYALLHCVGMYPTANEYVHAGFLSRMIGRYPGIPIGYSGHEDPENTDVVTVAVSLGAKILERHVGCETDEISLNAYSMNPEQTDAWVEASLRARAILGEGTDKEITQNEIDSLLSLRRGVFAKKEIKSGSEISKDDVFFAMPCETGQLTSGQFGRLRSSYTASRDYQEGTPLFESVEEDPTLEIRKIIHDAKGMLSEAHIVLADDDEIELSHHLGMEHFRETGALIVSVVNRQYCKKLVLVFPGQKHPNHRHIQKEETFQLIWGDLELQLNGDTIRMERGQKALVQRGDWHSFQSAGGAIFEEISTTHIIGDSFYEDEKISKLDPVNRKTVITGW